MRMFVTGAGGYAGSQLIAQAVRDGHSVRAHARVGQVDAAGAKALSDSGIELLSSSLDDSGRLADALAGCEVLVHLDRHASQPPARAASERGDNVADLRVLIDAAKAAEVRRLVFASTVQVYGARSLDDSETLSESDSVAGDQELAQPFWQRYAAPAVAAERLICAESPPSEYVILRLPLTYGNEATFAPAFVRRAMVGQRRRSPAHPTQWLHMDDLVQALLLAAQKPEAANEVFLIAGDETISSDELRQAISWMAPQIAQGSWQGWGNGSFEPMPAKFDISKACRLLGYQPKITLKAGLEEMVRHTNRTEGRQAARRTRFFDRGTSTEQLPYEDRIKDFYSRQLQMATDGSYFGGSDFWNWGLWNSDTETQEQACENLMGALLSFIPEKKGTILDVACGKGATTRHLLNYYEPECVTGINIAEDQLDVCRRIVPGVQFKVMDASKLSFEEADFDNIICVEAACHFETREQFWREALRVLKPGGRLVFSDPLQPIDAPMQPRENYVSSVDEYRGKCARAGFDKVHIEDVTRQCWGGFSSHLTKYLREKEAAGELTQSQLWGAMHWLQNLQPEAYVIGWCEKT